jgi:hypothetical protein
MPAKKPELYFRRPFRQTWTDDKGHTWTVTADLDFDQDGLRFTSLHISPAATTGPRSAITARVLQRMPLQKWISEFAAAKSGELQHAAASAPWAAMPVLQEKLAQAGRGPRASSVAFYGKVAKVYQEAQAAGKSPTKAVSERFGETRNLAATWVYRARKAGLLSKTEQGRAKG